MSLNNIYLISTFILGLTSPANASSNILDINSSLNNSSLFTSTLELNPLPSSRIQLASLKFLPEYANSSFSNHDQLDNDYNRGDCKDKTTLYTASNCSYPRALVFSSRCFSAPNYYRECSCLSEFSISSCTSPKIFGPDICNGKAKLCVCPSSVSLNGNDTCNQYCDGECISKSCIPTPDDTGCSGETSSESDGCGKTRITCAKCGQPSCIEITSKPANSFYITTSCTDCSGTKTINSSWTCDSESCQEGGS